MDVGRFAPSTTGPAHPGTLLAALLCWLDIRARGGRILLRLEDLDPERCRPEWAEGMRADLDWLGLDWDATDRQQEFAARHAAALDHLAAAGRLYPCACTRARIREGGRRAPDGGFRYPGRCRERALPPGGWRRAREPLRVRLPEGLVELRDESGIDLSQDPESEQGDPVVRRRDGAVAYLLATAVDDAASGVTRVVRGRDLAVTSATQVRLQQLLGLPTPDYRHHLLLLEERRDAGGARKLAKLHGAVASAALRARYAPAELCGLLAFAASLQPAPHAVTPRELVPGFDWNRVGSQDRLIAVAEDASLQVC